MGIKKFDIFVIGENNRPFLKATVNGRTYKRPFNPYNNPDKQCAEFTKEISDAERNIAMHESKDFYDYIFKVISGEAI